MNPQPRPVFLNPLRIRLPLAGWVSILHRLSGALLFVALPVAVWGLSISLSGESGFQRMAAWAKHPLVRFLLLLLIWAFAHHLLAGVRHLALDMHCGAGLQQSRQSSRAVMLAAGLVALLAAWRLFA